MTSETHATQRYALLNRVVADIVLRDASQEQLQGAFEDVARELGVEYYFHYRVDEADPAQLKLTSFSSKNEQVAKDVIAVRKGGQLSNFVAQSRQMLVLQNVHERDDERTAGVRSLGIKAYIGVPLVSHGTLFGTLSFASDTRAEFSDEDVDFVRLLADQFAAALDRAALVERLRANEQRHRNALVTGRIAAWETDLVNRTRIWTEEGMALFGLDLPDGIGQVGGENDEFLKSLHPEHKYLLAAFHQAANETDSFPAEYRIVRPDGRVLWVSGRGRVMARGPDGKAQRLDNIVMDITERKRAEEHAQLLMRELSHRAKNLLAIVQSIAIQTARRVNGLPEFRDAFSSRLQGLAATHDLLVEGDWRGAALQGLIRQQLAPFAEVGERLEINGPDIVLAPQAVQPIGMALHELATNAVKYGAWSRQGGKVTVAWELRNDEPALLLAWTESGGPKPSVPIKKGFGHVVLESMVATSVGGEVSIQLPPEGLIWKLTLSRSLIVSPS